MTKASPASLDSQLPGGWSQGGPSEGGTEMPESPGYNAEKGPQGYSLLVEGCTQGVSRASSEELRVRVWPHPGSQTAIFPLCSSLFAPISPFSKDTSDIKLGPAPPQCKLT